MNSKHRPSRATASCLRKHGLMLIGAALCSGPVFGEEQSITELSLDDLANAEVISAARKAQPLSETAAAVFVINRDTIRQSRATTIPELLRMVPGINVAQIDAHKWAVSSRGFNTRFSKYMLVMVDGRAVYDHTLSGVFWENLAVPLEEIERIEVVRGPGGALWGANAVNGIINIITRRATDTLGGVIAGGAGNVVEGSGTVRYGSSLGQNGYGRLYVNGIQHDAFNQTNGDDNHDGWKRMSGGLRTEWLLSPHDNLIIQADSFDGEFDQRGVRTLLVDPYLIDIEETTHGHGSNVLTRWEHNTVEHGNWQVQLYYDSNHHSEALYSLSNHTLDLDAQHRWPLSEQQELTWGIGYRDIENRAAGLSFPGISPSLEWHNKNIFLSDQIQLGDDLQLTVGAKWEDSGLTDDHLSPTIRFNWQPMIGWSFWGAYGEATRTPNRVEIDVEWLVAIVPPNFPPLNIPSPIALFLIGNQELDQERLHASEAGIRWLASDQLSLDVAAFHHEYHDVVMNQQSPPVFDPALGVLRFDFVQQNLASARSRGAELALQAQWHDRWHSQLSYSYLEVNVDAPVLQATTARGSEGSAPRHQLSLRHGVVFDDQWSLLLWLRWRDELSDATTTLDARTDVDLTLGWQYSEKLKLWLVGRNLTGNEDPDFLGNAAAEIDRSLYLSLRYDF